MKSSAANKMPNIWLTYCQLIWVPYIINMFVNMFCKIYFDYVWYKKIGMTQEEVQAMHLKTGGKRLKHAR